MPSIWVVLVLQQSRMAQGSWNHNLSLQPKKCIMWLLLLLLLLALQLQEPLSLLWKESVTNNRENGFFFSVHQKAWKITSNDFTVMKHGSITFKKVYKGKLSSGLQHRQTLWMLVLLLNFVGLISCVQWSFWSYLLVNQK